MSGAIVGSVLFSSVSFAAPAVVKLIVNGKEIHSEVPGQMINGSTLVPARALAEALGAKVTWDEANQAVIVEKPIAQFSAPDAVQMAGEAKNHYWYAANGGNLKGLVQSFPVKGRDITYHWMGDDLDTKVKYIAYFEQLFTAEQAVSFYDKQIETGIITEIDGRLAKNDADGGSLLNWAHATLKVIQDSADLKTYRFTVPLGDGGDGFEERNVNFRLIEGIGWRIDSPVESIY
ncbi:DL-endopeptidase inhibitor IseA family protein [Paenibacillus thalictri]|uniref:DL-endopeptidase inhibitor IseA family protein n=1 Tax=Paenibacillus thalictri TaxID=2527873 RepID=UPI0013EF1E66|nr:DL-endopeptidase inhibitor IseA family protein [Paenibacillus thalictri]